MTGAARPYRRRLGQSSHKAEDDISTRLSYLHERLSEIVDLAKGELFDLDPMPHVDIEAFGSWLSGISKDDENHILIPKRQPTIPSA
jgi:hypothetical protein